MKFRQIKKYMLGAVAAAILIPAGFVANRAYADTKPNDRILDNIYIGEVSVGGMTAKEAGRAVSEYVGKLQDTAFTLRIDKKNITASAGELGVEWENTGVVENAMKIGRSGSLITRYKVKKDLEHEAKKLPLSLGAEQSKIEAYLTGQKDNINQEAVDGSLTRENGAFTITDGKAGITVNVPASAKAIADYIANDWDMKKANLDLTADVVQPRGTRETLSKVKDVLGTFSTNYGGSAAGRVQNVVTGCGKLNGKLLYPGEQLSVYETVGPFDAENGYALGGSYENGMVVQSYGGGICQVSTTLYNAVIRAELDIKERYEHSMIVAYVQPSMDAAIAGTVKDLKFTNNTKAPIYIEGSAYGGTLTFSIYGEETRNAGREVIFESEVTSETTPPTQIRGSDGFPVGYVAVEQAAHQGKSAKLWKIVKENGEEKSREEFNSSTYYASPKIMIVGTGTGSKEARAYIEGAIAAQDETAIHDAAAQAAAIAQKELEEDNEPDKKEPDKKDPNKKNPSKNEPNKKDSESPDAGEDGSDSVSSQDDADTPENMENDAENSEIE